MNNNEKSYLETIFKAIPLMDDFEKGRLLGIAEEMERERKRVAKDSDASINPTAWSESSPRTTA